MNMMFVTSPFKKVCVYDPPDEEAEIAFSNLCVYCNLKHRLHVDARRKRIRKYAVTDVNEYLWKDLK